MLIKPSDVHVDPEKARLGVGLTAKALGIECDLRLSSQWLVKIDGNERAAFLELAREAANG
jgi:hypothetical protein